MIKIFFKKKEKRHEHSFCVHKAYQQNPIFVDFAVLA